VDESEDVAVVEPDVVIEEDTVEDAVDVCVDETVVIGEWLRVVVTVEVTVVDTLEVTVEVTELDSVDETELV